MNGAAAFLTGAAIYGAIIIGLPNLARYGIIRYRRRTEWARVCRQYERLAAIARAVERKQ
jgi:hypothetical protein